MDFNAHTVYPWVSVGIYPLSIPVGLPAHILLILIRRPHLPLRQGFFTIVPASHSDLSKLYFPASFFGADQYPYALTHPKSE